MNGMEKRINIIPLLERIVFENTHHYQSDFEYDRSRLQKATQEASKENRTFLWMSRPCGTHCVLESEVFQRETSAYSIWTHYEYEAKHIKAFRIIVSPESSGEIVNGTIQPLNYGEQVQRVKQNALHVQTVKLTFEDGKQYDMPYEDYRQQIRGLIDANGAVESLCYVPENERELFRVLQFEHTISARKKQYPHKKKPAIR